MTLDREGRRKAGYYVLEDRAQEEGWVLSETLSLYGKMESNFDPLAAEVEDNRKEEERQCANVTKVCSPRAEAAGRREKLMVIMSGVVPDIPAVALVPRPSHFHGHLPGIPLSLSSLSRWYGVKGHPVFYNKFKTSLSCMRLHLLEHEGLQFF